MGFETGAAALFSLAALSEAVAGPALLRPHRVAVFTALAFWTRMDALLVCMPALVLTAMNTAPRRRVLGPLTLLAEPRFRSPWPSPRSCTIGYSINNGGDLILVFGHDRYNATGGVFLAFALSTSVLVLAGSAVRGAVVALLGLASASGPFWFPVPVGAFWVLVDFFRLSRPALHPDTLAAHWSYQGKLLRQITKPGARIAVCAAGGTVYFSHRGGVDLLGKVEPLVAHLSVPNDRPPEARCWRGFPGAGHNKEDVPAVFEAHTPELSMVVPPASHAVRYTRIRYRGFEFFALRNSAYVNWKQVKIVD